MDENENTELERVRWDGEVSSPIGKTPFGFFDTDTEFVSFAPRAADWAARRLGYPIVDIEMQSGSFYACFEEAVTEYSSQVNQFNITDNLLSLKGQSTGSNLSQKNITPTMGREYSLIEQLIGNLGRFDRGKPEAGP